MAFYRMFYDDCTREWYLFLWHRLLMRDMLHYFGLII